jgi:hypothetical protein
MTIPWPSHISLYYRKRSVSQLLKQPRSSPVISRRLQGGCIPAPQPLEPGGFAFASSDLSLNVRSSGGALHVEKSGRRGSRNPLIRPFLVRLLNLRRNVTTAVLVTFTAQPIAAPRMLRLPFDVNGMAPPPTIKRSRGMLRRTGAPPPNPRHATKRRPACSPPLSIRRAGLSPPGFGPHRLPLGFAPRYARRFGCFRHLVPALRARSLRFTLALSAVSHRPQSQSPASPISPSTPTNPDTQPSQPR